MSCFHPLRAWKVGDSITFRRPKKQGANCEELQLPCSKCIGCLLDKASDYAVRCWCEAKNWENNCFITLTYNNKNLPENGMLCKKDVQDFMKRLRYFHEGIEEWTNPQTGKREKPIRYLLCGEYGPNGTHRPHYHILIFNWRPEKLKFWKYNFRGEKLYKCDELYKKDPKKPGIWGKGFVTVGDLTYESACYVARYCSKKLFKGIKHETLKKAEIQPEFILLSRNGGIGLKYWQEHKNQILNTGIMIKQKNKRIPKYFERKFKELDENSFNKYRLKKILRGKLEFKRQLDKTSLTESEYKEAQERKLKNATKILKRNNFL